MNSLVHFLSQLTDISQEMLKHLNTEQPSMDKLQDMMHQRSRLIDEMEPLIHKHNVTSFSSEEQELLTEGFQTFRHLHNSIQPAMEELMEKQKELLGEASRKRKAEDRYHLLGTPDISYFSEK